MAKKRQIHPMALELVDGMAKKRNPADAKIMQGYMKTEQPFFGLKTPVRRAVFKECKERFPVLSETEFEDIVRTLWGGTHREEMYMALDVVDGYKKQYLNVGHWSLYRDLVHTATWWDTLDWISTRQVGEILKESRSTIGAEVFSWSDHESFWVRRASLLPHLKHKEEMDLDVVEATILKLAHEKEFFIRKAIGWVLRHHSRSNPKWVVKFVKTHEDILSPLSKREALRLLKDPK